MAHLDDVLVEAPAAASAGGTLVAARALVGCLPDADRIDRDRLYATLGSVVAGSPALTVAERDALVALVQNCEHVAPTPGAYDKMLRFLGTQAAADEADVPGRVSALFAAVGHFLGRPFGTVHTLAVTSEPWGHDVELILPGARTDPALYQAFRNATMAVRGYFLGQGFEPIYGSILFNTFKFVGQLPTVRTGASGESIGLASAMGIVSSLLQHPIPWNAAFSAQIDIRGGVLPVGGLNAKLRAAADRGITRVFVSAEQELPTDVPVAVDVLRVDSLADAIAQVFESGVVADGIERLKALQVPDWARQRTWRDAQGLPADAPRILLSAIGKSDPIGTHKDEHGLGFGQSEGPCLVAARHVHPTAAYLFYTSEAAAGRHNEFTANATDTARFLETQPDGCSAHPVVLDEVADPTDVEQLLRALRARVEHVVAEHGDKVAYFTNVSSGTPQMLIVWHLLAERDILPGVLVQVREHRYVHDEPPVRPVVLPRW